MRNLIEESVEIKESKSGTFLHRDTYVEAIYGVRIGKLVSVEHKGHILVDYEDNFAGPLSARCTVNILSADEGRDILLVFEKGDPLRPIIIGLIQEQPVISTQEIALNRGAIGEIIADGERITFNANDQIELRCGKSSLVMRSNGKVIIKGIQIVSRASRANKLKGAAIQIN